MEHLGGFVVCVCWLLDELIIIDMNLFGLYIMVFRLYIFLFQLFKLNMGLFCCIWR